MCNTVAFLAILTRSKDLQVGFAMQTGHVATLDRADVINLVDDTGRFSEPCGFVIEGSDGLGVSPRWHRLLFRCPAFQTSSGNDIWIRAAPLSAAFGVDGPSSLAQRLNAFLLRFSVYAVTLASLLSMSQVVRLTVRGLGFYVRGCVRFVFGLQFLLINLTILLLMHPLLLRMCRTPRRMLEPYFLAISGSISTILRTAFFWMCGIPCIGKFALTRQMGCAVGLLVGPFIERHDAWLVYQMGAA